MDPGTSLVPAWMNLNQTKEQIDKIIIDSFNESEPIL